MIDIQNVSFRYPGQRQSVFNDFSLCLRQNCIYGLLGKNGTGKSTLLYLIAGLLRPQRGAVRFAADGSACGDSAADAPASAPAFERRAAMLADVFIVPEEFSLPSMTLDSYLRVIAPFYPRFSHEVLSNCLREFELPPTLRLDAISMGQKKKVYVSIALAAGTSLLLMDEPTNGLDIPSKSLFRRVVAQNMTDDRTLIISTHQVHDVEPLLDHLLILSDEGLLLNASVPSLTDRYAFSVRPAGTVAGDSVASAPDVLYAEPTLQGNAVITRRREDDPETQLNLELLFNAVTKGLLK